MIVASPLLALLFAAGSVAASAQTNFGVRTAPGEDPEVGQKVSGATDTFSCTVSSVHDGDTFRCTNGVKVRLSSIDTPEMPGACRPGRSCAPGDPYAARAVLAKLISGKTIHCEAAGKSYDRVAAWCSAGGADLSCAMIRSGHAVKLSQYDGQRRLDRC